MIKIKLAPHAGATEILELTPSEKELQTEEDLYNYIAFELFRRDIKYKWFKVIT